MVSFAAESVQGYRQALGTYPTGVCVVTADLAVGAAAITVNSFVSISLEPRIVLWSLADISDRYARFAGADRWGVSVLTPAQEDLARIFAEKGARRAEDAEIERIGDGGAPLIKGALAQFDCRTKQREHVGDHLVIFGEVVGFAMREGPSLTYYRGAFGATN